MYWKNSGIVIDSKYSQNDLYLVKILSPKGIWTGLAKENVQITTIVNCSWSSKTEDSLGKWYFFFKKTHHFVSMLSHKIFFLCMVDLCKMCKTFCKERNDDDILFSKVIELINVISTHESYASSIENGSSATNDSHLENSSSSSDIRIKISYSYLANYNEQTKDFHSYIYFLKLFLQFKIFFVKEIVCLDEKLIEALNEELGEGLNEKLKEKLNEMLSEDSSSDSINPDSMQQHEVLNTMNHKLQSLSCLDFICNILNQIHNILIQDNSLNAQDLHSMKKHKNLIEKEIESLKLKLK